MRHTPLRVPYGLMNLNEVGAQRAVDASQVREVTGKDGRLPAIQQRQDTSRTPSSQSFDTSPACVVRLAPVLCRPSPVLYYRRSAVRLIDGAVKTSHHYASLEADAVKDTWRYATCTFYLLDFSSSVSPKKHIPIASIARDVAFARAVQLFSTRTHVL